MDEIEWVENTVVYEKHPPTPLGFHEQAVLKQHCFQEGAGMQGQQEVNLNWQGWPVAEGRTQVCPSTSFWLYSDAFGTVICTGIILLKRSRSGVGPEIQLF